MSLKPLEKTTIGGLVRRISFAEGIAVQNAELGNGKAVERLQREAEELRGELFAYLDQLLEKPE